MRTICIAIFLFALQPLLRAAPMTGNELDLMVRMGVREDEIVRDVGNRRLLSPLDAATEQKLAADGASKSLIAKIKAGNFALDPESAAIALRSATEANSAAARENAKDEAAYAARLARLKAPAANQSFLNTFTDALQQLDGSGKLVACSADNLKNVRYFALYNSALWCGPCRAFTPQLVETYNRLKPRHPEFEVILLSADHSPVEMENYMKADKMPWPAVKFDRVSAFEKYTKGSIPWMIVLDQQGNELQPTARPAGSPGRDDGWVHPSAPLAWVTQTLGG